MSDELLESAKRHTIEQGDKLLIKTPYHKEFIQDIKLIPHAKWTGDGWTVPMEYKKQARDIVEKYFPSVKTSRLMLFDVHREHGDSFTIDGRYLMWVDRDNTRFSGKLENIEVIADDIESMGSRKNPRWRGSFIVRHHGAEKVSSSTFSRSSLIIKGDAAMDVDVTKYIRDEIWKRDIPKDNPIIDEPTCNQICNKLSSLGYPDRECKFINDAEKSNACRINSKTRRTAPAPKDDRTSVLMSEMQEE